MTDAPASGARVAEAFMLTADPSAYVPRLALESALADLTEGIGKTPACTALSGEAGLGKTLLLKVLRERLTGAFECLYVPFPRLAESDLWRWAAAALGLGPGEDDRGAVLARAERLAAAGSGLVLLVDDAGALPSSTRGDLLAALDAPGFSLVLAFNSGEHPQLRSLPAYVRRVELGPPMTLAETRAYLQARLRRADPDGAVSARLTSDQLAALHEASSGVPAQLHPLLDAWLRSLDPAPNETETEARVAPARAPAAPELRGVAPSESRGAALPARVRIWLERLQSPAVGVTLLTVIAVATLTAWYFAWQNAPGITSVGVPVLEETSAVPEPPAAPEPPPADAATPPVAAEPPSEAPPATKPGVEPIEPAEAAPATATEGAPTSAHPPGAPAAHAHAERARLLVPLLLPPPPLPEPGQPELPVHLSSLRFQDEHVPPLLEDEPLAAAPAGPLLNVNAEPWAAISLDGQPVGETPLGELRVSPGAHVVSARLPDGRVVERRVEASADDVYVVFP
jgi:type II secretory pathway predicted ATPase ExeA